MHLSGIGDVFVDFDHIVAIWRRFMAGLQTATVSF